MTDNYTNLEDSILGAADDAQEYNEEEKVVIKNESDNIPDNLDEATNTHTNNLEDTDNTTYLEDSILDAADKAQEYNEEEKVVIKIESENIPDNLDEATDTHTNNLEEVIIKGEPEDLHDEYNIREDPLLDDDTCTDILDKGTTNNAGSTFTTKKRARRTHNCTLCPKSFSTLHNLTRHQVVHTGEKPYQCGICEKGFTSPGTVKIHQRIHTGEKPFQCDVCQRAFASNKTLVIHKRTHTGERPFQCDECEKAFSLNKSLMDHKRIHTGEKPYRCDLCDKAFTQQTSLVAHKRLHTGEEPYACELCPYKCTTNNKLFSHKQTHIPKDKTIAAVKSHECDVCKKCFITNSLLNKHCRLQNAGGVL